MNKYKPKWKNTPFDHLRYTLVRTQEQFNSLSKVTHDTSVIDMSDCNASAILYDLCAVVFVGDIERLNEVRQIGIIFHEAVHIWQHLKERMGEEAPSVEFEAYSIQKIGEDLLNMFNESKNERH